MFSLLGNRASILPPTLPKSGLNPVTKIIAYPVKVVIDSFVRESSLMIAAISAKDLRAQEILRQQRATQAHPLGVRSRIMSLQTMTAPPAGLHPGYSDPNWSGELLAPAPSGGDGAAPGGLADMVYLPVEPDTPITETDLEEVVIEPISPVATPPKVTTQIADQIISGGGIAVTPDASASIVRPGPALTITPGVPVAPTITTGPTTYTYKDLKGHVVFNIENKSMNQMPFSALVSVRIGEVELVRTNFKTRLMPLKTKQFKSEFILEGDQSALVKAIKGDLTASAFPEAVVITIDAVIQWHMFRNSVTQTLTVPLETGSTF